MLWLRRARFPPRAFRLEFREFRDLFKRDFVPNRADSEGFRDEDSSAVSEAALLRALFSRKRAFLFRSVEAKATFALGTRATMRRR